MSGQSLETPPPKRDLTVDALAGVSRHVFRCYVTPAHAVEVAVDWCGSANATHAAACDAAATMLRCRHEDVIVRYVVSRQEKR